MNKDLSILFKEIQVKIKKKATFREAITLLIKFRKDLVNKLDELRNDLTENDFSKMPYLNAKGYHNKTIAYSIYHLSRIEDIVSNSLISEQDEIFFVNNYQTKLHSKIITTGNELIKEDIGSFSKDLVIDVLYSYLHEVVNTTNKLLETLTYEDSLMRIKDEEKNSVIDLHVVSENEEANWLIDYWCNKNIQGLILMPFSRHWLMHIDASLRIKDKIIENKKKLK